MRRLTSEQYVKIDAAAKALPLSQRHAFLARLANKINLDALATRNRTVSDLALSSMIGAALHCSARDDAIAKELDRLIKLHSDNN
jgi:hypothetical protein